MSFTLCPALIRGYASRQEAAEKARAAASLAAERLKEYVAGLAATQPVITPVEGATSTEDAAPPGDGDATLPGMPVTSLTEIAEANLSNGGVTPATATLLAAPVVV